MIEAYLAARLLRHGASAYEVLFSVYNSDPEPTARQRVTLSHVYAHLGKSLAEWLLWPTFVDRLNPKLLRLARVKGAALLADPSLVRVLFERLMAERARRVPSRIGFGEADLLDPIRVVRRRQRHVSACLREEQEDGGTGLGAKAGAYFPILR